MKLPESLRREEIIIEPDEDTRDCKKMGEEITEVLEYQPRELYVKQYRRIKYARPDNYFFALGDILYFKIMTILLVQATWGKMKKIMRREGPYRKVP